MTPRLYEAAKKNFEYFSRLLILADFPKKVIFRSVGNRAGQDVADGQAIAPEVGHAVDFRGLTAAAAVEGIIRPVAFPFDDAFLPGTDQGLIDLKGDDGLFLHEQISAFEFFTFGDTG